MTHHKQSAAPQSTTPRRGIMRVFQLVANRWFLLMSLALVAFIVLFPKIPLFDLIPGYIVRVRIEDFLVAFALLIYGVQLLRRKASLKSPATAIFIFYGVVGVLSILNAMFLVKTVPLNMLHVGKMILHFARRLEYFSVFFLFYHAIRARKDAKLIILGVALILIGVTVYGYGQKYLYWPVYSTMNREFSKGVRLVLTEHARVPSTFGGHYDMSAFVMVILTIILGAFFYAKNKLVKLSLMGVFLSGFWLLILGSSRSSFLAYLVAITILVGLITIQKWSLWWGISRYVVVMGFSLFVLVSFGDLSSRFTQLGFVKQLNQSVNQILHPVGEKPKNAIAVDPIDKTDQLPVVPTPVATKSAVIVKATPKPGDNKPLPPDVYVNIPDIKTVTSTVSGKTVTTTIEVPREFSPCTYKYGLSACIRFDTLWPRALNGFKRNPLLGSGFSTLTKSSKDEFTEAESTDNDFLRNLGESGILGVIGFYGSIFLFIWMAAKRVQTEQSPFVLAILLGLVAASLGLFFNALYIDVFEASKVAFTYWALMGAAFGLMMLDPQKK